MTSVPPVPDADRELRRAALIERRIVARRRFPADVQARLGWPREVVVIDGPDDLAMTGSSPPDTR